MFFFLVFPISEFADDDLVRLFAELQLLLEEEHFSRVEW